MGVAAQVPQGVLDSAERPFAVYDPLRAIRLADERDECVGGFQRLQSAVETQLAVLKGLLESHSEFTAEDFLQHGHRQEEARLGADPSATVGSQTAGRNHAVDVRMMQELLIPGMQHAEEADIGAQTFWVPGHPEQGFGAGSKQQVVDHLLVLER